MVVADWIKIVLPRPGHIGRFMLWGTGRVVFSGCLFCVDATSHTLTICNTLLRWTRQSIINLVRVYDQLPYAGTYGQNIIDVTAQTLDEPEEIITDIVEAIEGKQVMVIGEMGSGKSSVAQYLAYTVGGQVKVYEPEGTPEDWSGLEVIGKGEDWELINESMQADLDDLSNQMKLRMEQGDKAITGTERVIICEEYPELVRKVAVSGEWLERHARRGRKARRFTILLSQYDRVAAWGLEGKADLQEAFFKLRLGKKAVSHAKQLKNDQLVDWLRSDRSHCLLDDYPCKLPSYREMKAVTKQLYQLPGNQSPVIAETTVQQELEPIVSPEKLDREVVFRVVKACTEAGFSDSKIIKEFLGYQGSQYQQGKEILADMRREDG
jgi:energy-coupling factor transporter ATP-binding protein EcfA2